MLIEKLRNYTPYNEQEKIDREVMISFLENNSDAYVRDNKIGHMTASAWVVNETYDKVLFCYHRIYDSWAWLGGHADGDRDLRHVALKEAKEESGLKDFVSINDDILSIEILPVSGHIKKGKYQPSHLHFNVTYLFVAREGDQLVAKADENAGLAWIPFGDIKSASSEPWFVENIYQKLIDKVGDICVRDSIEK